MIPTHAPASELLYIADPMCSWCYGFSPEITRIKSEYQDVLDFRVVLGGLRPGTTQVMDEPSKDQIAHHWHQVHARTGQEFNFDFFKREDFVLDSEPASKAVVVVRELWPDMAFEAFQAIQFAFYKENVDVTDERELARLVEPFRISEEKFLTLFRDPQLGHQTKRDYEVSRRLGATVFPSLFLQAENQVFTICRGYRTYDDIKPIIDRSIHQAQVKR